MRNYSVGFVTKNENEDYIASCNCGTIRFLRDYNIHYGTNVGRLGVKCENCSNNFFVDLRFAKRVSQPYLSALEKSYKGFKLMRTNLSVYYDEDYNVLTKANMIQVLSYDIVNEKIRLWKNGEEIKLYNLKDTSCLSDEYIRFFRSIEPSRIIKEVSTDSSYELFNFALRYLSDGNGWNSNKKFYRGLIRLFEHKHLQILANAGYTNIERFYERNTYWSKTKTLNVEGTNPKDILGVPSFFLSHIREDESISINDIKEVKSALKNIDGNRFKELLEIVKDESTVRKLCGCIDTVMEIHDKYKYNNLKKLTLYIFRETRMNQGIGNPSNTATLLRDYLRMATALEQEYEKYPKSLKKDHDVTLMNYNVKKDEMKNKIFKEVVESEAYVKLEYKKKDFSLIRPSTMEDLIKEGNDLSHCVASYVESINNEKCQILFLRDSENLEKPLATVEVRGGNVRQARGYANRPLNGKEKDFISEWAKKKELEQNYYY